MGRPTNMRAASAASADEAEAQQAISLASARPSRRRSVRTGRRLRSQPRNRMRGSPDAEPAAKTDATTPLHRLDVAGRIKMLRDAFERHAHPDSKPDQKHWQEHLSRVAQLVAPHRSRLVKVGIGALLVVAVGWLPVRTLLQTTSTEAVINARLITLRAPIEGEIGAGLGATAVGMQLEPGAGLMKIVNRRAERGRLDDLHRLINRLESERAGLTSRRNDLQAMHKDLSEQTQAFMDGRSRQLEARIAELTSEIAAAAANRQEAERALARATPLAESKTITNATLREGEARCNGCDRDACRLAPPPRRHRGGSGIPAQGRVHRRQLQRPAALLAARRRGGAAPERSLRRPARARDAARKPAHRAFRRDETLCRARGGRARRRRCGAACGKS